MIKIKRQADTEICAKCMKYRLQQKSSQTQMRKARKFWKEINSDLKWSLSLTHWEKQYYISFYDDAIETDYFKTILHKSQVIEKFLEFISWTENQSRKMLKRYSVMQVESWITRFSKPGAYNTELNRSLVFDIYLGKTEKQTDFTTT